MPVMMRGPIVCQPVMCVKIQITLAVYYSKGFKACLESSFLS